MLLRGHGILKGPQNTQFQPFQGFVFQLKLKLRVKHIQVHVVVLQLVQDVERRIVGYIIRTRVKRARCVQRIRVRVNVEIAFHLSVHHIHILTQCSGRFLFTIRGSADDVERKIIEQMMGSVQVNSISVYITLLVPTRINHSTQRGIIVRFGGTTTHTNRVVLHNGRRKELLKPVGIAKFSLLQISIAPLNSVGNGKFTRCWVVRIYQFVHFSIYAVVASVQHIREFQPAFALQFAINIHLFLRV